MNNVSAVLAKLHEIATILARPTAGRPLREVLQEVAAKLPGLLDADHSTITLLDEGGHFFRVEAEFPQLATPLLDRRIPIHGKPTQIGLIERQEPVIADDLSSHALVSELPHLRNVAQNLDIRSVLIVPMVADGNTIGTISLDSIGRNRCFPEEDVALCLTVANQVANFVGFSRLRNEEQTGASEREEKVTRRLFDELATVIEFKKASLQLILNGKRILVGAFGFDKSRAHPWLLRPIEADPILREIVHSRRPKIIPETAANVHWEKQSGTSDVASWIGMPLVFQDDTVGILTLDHDQAGFYGNILEDVLTRAQQMAIQAVHDLWAAYNLEVAQRQVQALEVVRRFAEAVATKLDPQDVLLTVVSEISKGLECTRCSIFLAGPHPEGQILVHKAFCQGTSSPTAQEWVLPTPPKDQLTCPAYHAFQSGDSILIEDRQRDSRFTFVHEFYKVAGSMIAVPLKTGDQAIGTILALHEREGWFSKADQLLLETLARQAASAYERDCGLELVHSIGKKILGATEVKKVLENVVSGAMEITHTDSGVIYELNEDCIQVIRSFMDEGSDHPAPRLDDPNSITRTVIAQKSLIEIPDIKQDKRVNPKLQKSGYRSMFALPLLLGQSVVGVLYLNGKSVRGLTETERSLLGTLVGQAALAIQRARLFEQIRDSDALYRSLVDHIPQYVFRKDRNSRFTWANASFCESLGKSLPEIIGKTDFDFYPKECAEKYVHDDIAVMQAKKPQAVMKPITELHQPPGKKPRILVQVVKTPVLDAKGNVTGVQAIFWDITEEMEEKKLAERWRSLAEQSPDGIVVHEGGKITLANPAAVRLFGVKSDDDLKGRPLFDFLDERSSRFAKARLDLLERGEEVQPVEMCVLRGLEDKVDVAVYTRRVPETGEIQVVFHDITRAKTILREMHHRVRRSFNQIAGFLMLQESYSRENPDVLHAFDTIRDRIQAMALVHSILFRTGEESDVEMVAYLEELRKALVWQHGAGEKVAVDFSIAGMLLNEKQATACGLIVTELVSNSLQHAFPPQLLQDRNGQVSVSLRPQGEMFELAVRDNGIGLKKTLSHANDTMGLSLVRSLVADDLKGTIKVTSARPGTRFAVKFPSKIYKKDVRHAK